MTTKDGKFLSDGNITYHRVVFFIKNNHLNEGKNVFIQEAIHQTTYSSLVYSKVKEGYEKIILAEIETLMLIIPDK